LAERSDGAVRETQWIVKVIVGFFEWVCRWKVSHDKLVLTGALIALAIVISSHTVQHKHVELKTATGSLETFKLRLETCRFSRTYAYISSFYFAPVGVRSIVINPSVCLSVCLSAGISLEPLDRSS